MLFLIVCLRRKLHRPFVPWANASIEHFFLASAVANPLLAKGFSSPQKEPHFCQPNQMRFPIFALIVAYSLFLAFLA